ALFDHRRGPVAGAAVRHDGAVRGRGPTGYPRRYPGAHRLRVQRHWQRRRRLACAEAGRVAEVGRGGADEDGVGAGGNGEAAAGLVVVGQVAGAQAEGGEPALPGRELDAGVALELLGRLLRGPGRDEVELEGGRARPRGPVRDARDDGGGAAGPVVGRGHAGDGEALVGQAVAEQEQRPLPGRVVPAVAHVEALVVLYGAVDAGIARGLGGRGRALGVAGGEGDRQ